MRRLGDVGVGRQVCFILFTLHGAVRKTVFFFKNVLFCYSPFNCSIQVGLTCEIKERGLKRVEYEGIYIQVI